MTPADFLPLVETILSTAGVSFERRAVVAFVTSMWPMIEDDPDAGRWANEFLAASVAQIPAD
jgi:hypothetical protein